MQANSDAIDSKTTLLDAKQVNDYVSQKALSFINGIDQQSLTPDDEFVIREMVKAFEQSTEDQRFLSLDAFLIIIDIMEILTKPEIYSKLQDDEDVFINDYVQLLGNLLRIQANYSSLTNRRLLQSS